MTKKLPILGQKIEKSLGGGRESEKMPFLNAAVR